MNIKQEANMKELTANNSTTSPTNTQHHHQGDIKFRIVHIDAFITVMKILNNFCETVNFEFSSECLQVVATDGMFDRFTVVRFSLPIQQKQTLNANFSCFSIEPCVEHTKCQTSFCSSSFSSVVTVSSSRVDVSPKRSLSVWTWNSCATDWALFAK